MKLYLTLAVVLSIFLGGCHSAQRIESNFGSKSFETMCISCNGTQQTVRAWGKGMNKDHALDQCRKQALRDIIFKGITLGEQSCIRRPLVAEVNAEERHRAFFSEFFSDKGRWKKYAVLSNKGGAKPVSKNYEIETWEATVTVDIAALAKYLQEKGLTTINY